MTDKKTGVDLLNEHRAELRASGLSDETIKAARIYSITSKWVASQLGYGHLTGNLPALALPLLTVDRNGGPDLNQVRVKPARPRLDPDGKTVKYETKKATANRIYVPDSALAVKDDANVPLNITEGEKKALAACQAGKPTIALAGVWSFLTKDAAAGPSKVLTDFDAFAWKGREVFIVFDSDLADNPHVAQAETRLAEELQRRGSVVKAKRLPGGPRGGKVGLDDYLLNHSVEEFDGLPAVEIETPGLLDDRLAQLERLREAEKAAFAKWQIFPLLAKVDDLNRERYSRLLKTALGVPLKVIRDEVRQAVPIAEVLPDEIPHEVIERGRIFAATLGPRPLDKVLEASKACGVVGEDRNVKIIYLAITSRRLDKPVSIVIKGVSSGGKSFTVEIVLMFFPASAYWARTGLSPRALAYSDEDFKHRMLVIFEAAGLGEEGDYLLRSLLSEGRLLYETVESTANGLRNKVIEKEGPTGCILTTTRIRLHPENETRILSLAVNDTKEQTAAVLKHTAKQRAMPDLSDWQAYQTYLAAESPEVAVPYAENLAEAIPPVAVRLRRDFSALLSLIKAHALLCIAERERDDQGRIIATAEDYEVVRELVLPVMSEGVQSTVKETIREAVKAVEGLLSEDKETATVKEIADKLKIDKATALRRVKEAISLGYLENEETGRGRKARIKLDEPLPENVDILPKKIEGLSGSDTDATAQPLDVSPGQDNQKRLQPPCNPGATPKPTVAEGLQRPCNPKNEDNSSSEGQKELGLQGCNDMPEVDTPNSFNENVQALKDTFGAEIVPDDEIPPGVPF